MNETKMSDRTPCSQNVVHLFRDNCRSAPQRKIPPASVLQRPFELYTDLLIKLGRNRGDALRLEMFTTIVSASVMLSSHMHLLRQAVDTRILQLQKLQEKGRFVDAGAIDQLSMLSTQIESNLAALLSGDSAQPT